MISLISEEQAETLLTGLDSLGQLVEVKDGRVSRKESSMRRFIKENTGSIIRRPWHDTIINDSTFPWKYISFGFETACQTLIPKDPILYSRLIHIADVVENIASSNFGSCELSVVLLCSNRFGDKLFPHVHRRSEHDTNTMTFFVRLTNTGVGAEFGYWDIMATDKQATAIYKNPLRLNKAIAGVERKSFKLNGTLSYLTFDSVHIPHEMIYGDDIYLAFVYDQISHPKRMTIDELTSFELDDSQLR